MVSLPRKDKDDCGDGLTNSITVDTGVHLTARVRVPVQGDGQFLAPETFVTVIT